MVSSGRGDSGLFKEGVPSSTAVQVDENDLALWLERLTANAEVVTVLGSIPASSDTMESEGRQTKQC